MSRNCGGRRSGWPGRVGVGGGRRDVGCWGGGGRLTRLLWRACSRVVLKRKQRQGTPASRAHLMYLWGPGKWGGWLRARGPPYRGCPWDPGTWLGSGCPGSCCQSRPVSFASGPPRTWSRSAATSPECPGGPRKRPGMGARRPRGTENQRGRPRDRGLGIQGRGERQGEGGRDLERGPGGRGQNREEKDRFAGSRDLEDSSWGWGWRGCG